MQMTLSDCLFYLESSVANNPEDHTADAGFPDCCALYVIDADL